MIYVTHDQVGAMTLASKIALLNAGPAVQRDGSVAQFGPPLELYHHPVNKFVAGFIGSPKMNFIAARLGGSDGKTSLVRVGEAEFTAEVDARKLQPNVEVTLGVRPEHVQVVAPGGANTLHGLVAFIEQLGEASYVYVRLAAGELVTVRETGQSTCTVGDPVHLHFPANSLHLFDSEEHACKRTARAEGLSQQPHVAGVSISRAATAG